MSEYRPLPQADASGKFPHHGMSDAAAKSFKRGKRCVICGSTQRLAIDHCHETGRIRGVLCGPCNSGLGMFHDSPEKLERAIEYLQANGAVIAPALPDPVYPPPHCDRRHYAPDCGLPHHPIPAKCGLPHAQSGKEVPCRLPHYPATDCNRKHYPPDCLLSHCKDHAQASDTMLLKDHSLQDITNYLFRK